MTDEGEKILKELQETEVEIKKVDQKRIEIVQRLQKLKAKAENLKNKYNKLKTKEVSSINWAQNEYGWHKKIHEILNNTFKLKAFRHQQLAAINALLSKKDVILLMPTGGGKSLCYQLPSLVTRGVTIVVSPLLSLIDDQIISLKKLGIDAIALNSNSGKEVSKKVYDTLSNGPSSVKLIYVTPEWMAKSKRFMNNLQKCHSKKLLDRIAIDKPDVRFVIHYSMPKSMANFYQESGRAGRDDKRADCILFYSFRDVFRNSSMVCTTQTGTENLYKMVEYCLDAKTCRRSTIATHFDDVWDASDCNQMCDHCLNSGNYETIDITKYCQQLYLIIDFNSKTETRLTAVKLLDAWFKSNSKIPKVDKPNISRELAENIVTFLMIRNYLKEDIHFTPYSTISYLSRGLKANSEEKILMDVYRRLRNVTGEVQNNHNNKRINDQESSSTQKFKKVKIN